MSDNLKKDKEISNEYVGEEYFDEQKGNSFVNRLEVFLESRYFIAVCFVLLSFISFYLGRISGIKEKREPVKVINNTIQTDEVSRNVRDTNQTASVPIPNTPGQVLPSPENQIVVGSKNGTRYHYPWCPGAKQIAEKNLITFNSIEEARAKGYTPAANCKGLR